MLRKAGHPMTLIEKMAKAIEQAEVEIEHWDYSEWKTPPKDAAKIALAVVCEALREPDAVLMEEIATLAADESPGARIIWSTSARDIFHALVAYLEGEGE